MNDGRWFRTLTVLDLYTREALALVADRSLTGVKVAAALTPLVHRWGAPEAITIDNGSEFVSRAMDAWAHAHGVRLDFIRPGRLTENAFIESFNGRLHDECLNVHVFGTVAEAQTILDGWRDDYNHVRPHSSLRDHTPTEWRARVDQQSHDEHAASREPGGGHRAPTLDAARSPWWSRRDAAAPLHERSSREEGELRVSLILLTELETAVGSVTRPV